MATNNNNKNAQATKRASTKAEVQKRASTKAGLVVGRHTRACKRQQQRRKYKGGSCSWQAHKGIQAATTKRASTKKYKYKGDCCVRTAKYTRRAKGAKYKAQLNKRKRKEQRQKWGTKTKTETNAPAFTAGLNIETSVKSGFVLCAFVLCALLDRTLVCV